VSDKIKCSYTVLPINLDAQRAEVL